MWFECEVIEYEEKKKLKKTRRREKKFLKQALMPSWSVIGNLLLKNYNWNEKETNERKKKHERTTRVHIMNWVLKHWNKFDAKTNKIITQFQSFFSDSRKSSWSHRNKVSFPLSIRSNHLQFKVDTGLSSNGIELGQWMRIAIK